MLSRLYSFPESSEAPYFSDTKDDQWYSKDLRAAIKAGIINEKAGEAFRPNDPITRSEFAAMIYNLDEKKEGTAPFEDIKGHKFEKEINQAYANGRFKGYVDGSFRPDASMQRAEIIAVLNRLLNRSVDRNGLEKAANAGSVRKFIDLVETHWAYYEIVEATNTHRYERIKGTTLETWIEILGQLD